MSCSYVLDVDKSLLVLSFTNRAPSHTMRSIKRLEFADFVVIFGTTLPFAIRWLDF